MTKSLNDSLNARYRDILAVAVTVLVVVIASRIVGNAGFGFFPVWFLSSIACPIVASVVPRKHVVGHAIAANFGWHVILFGSMAMTPTRPPTFGGWVIFAILTAISVFFSVAIGFMAGEIRNRRRRKTNRL